MPKPIRFGAVVAAASLVAFPLAGLGQETLPKANLFAGPAHVGESVAYRIVTTDGVDPQATPSETTVVLNWKTPTRMFARASSGASTMATMVTRGDDGILTLASSAGNDPNSSLLATRVAQLNFPSRLAALLGNGDHAQTSLQVQPPALKIVAAPTSTASPAPQKTPGPVIVPVSVDLIGTGNTGSTLIAEGNSNRPSAFGRGGEGGGGHRGGGMGGGWQRGGSMGGGRRPGGGMPGGGGPSTEIAVEATFDQSGMLLHETYRETFTTAAPNGTQTVERTVTIDRV